MTENEESEGTTPETSRPSPGPQVEQNLGSQAAIVFGLFAFCSLAVNKLPSFPYNIWVFQAAYLSILFMLGLEKFSDQDFVTRKTFHWYGAGLIILLGVKTVFDLGFGLPKPEPTARFFGESLIIGPVLEEFLYRKVLFKNVSRFVFGGRFLFSAVVVSLAFTFNHPQTDIVSLTAVFTASMVYSLVYFKTNRIEVPIVCHVFFNAIGIWI